MAGPHPSTALHREAETLSSGLPELLLAAEHLARTVTAGAHSRRQAGAGPDFWQYRAALPGDPARAIDWRRSARSDQAFVAEREWALAQSLQIWRSPAHSMAYRSRNDLPTKADRASLLGLAVAVLALRGGERVGLADGRLPPTTGERQAAHMLRLWQTEQSQDEVVAPPPPQAKAAIAVYLSDGLAPLEAWQAMFSASLARRMRGVVVLVNDPAERDFPFQARTRFASMGGGLTHETDRAEGLRAAYQSRRSHRHGAIAAAAHGAGWHVLHHDTDHPAAPALAQLWRRLAQTAEGAR